jgi:hypothetical protein
MPPASLLEVSGAVEFGIRVTPAPAVCEWLQAEILANTGSIHNEDHGHLTKKAKRSLSMSMARPSSAKTAKLH